MISRQSASRLGLRLGLFLIVAHLVVSAVPGGVAQTPGEYEGNCTDAACHGSYTKLPVVHAPVEDEACDACHEQKPGEKHAFEFTSEMPDLCYDCHDEFEGKVVHDPVGGGECLACHNPHGGTAKRLLTADSAGEVCAECHEEITEDLSYLHGPAAAGECTACHRPHVSEHAKLLVSSGPSLCTECHTTIEERLEDSKHVHPPVEEGCTDCHNPHGAENKLLLLSEVPEMCVDCHDDIGDQAEDASVKHSPVTTGGACVQCHDPHAGDFTGMLRVKPIELCLSCHSKEVTGSRGTLVNIGEHLKKNPNRHGPVGDGECTPCHDPHGTDSIALLREAYPSKFYSPFGEEQYALCFECHDVEAFEDSETDDTTEFRNGTRNLHHLHVNRKVKGRTCRACHDPHASTPPKLITEGSAFGKWKIPVNYTPTATGGSCQPGCHRRYRYDREQAIVNVKPD